MTYSSDLGVARSVELVFRAESEKLSVGYPHKDSTRNSGNPFKRENKKKTIKKEKNTRKVGTHGFDI